ncbi:zinc-binding dehydrogenase [Cohnella sp. GCM10012308]|uniref:zinc-binding dehydrogenase n=1 Tax=Cohnella sp. GCM10012308 TaxID=3317329 RepID=UPI00361C3268
MKAIVVETFGGPETLKLSEIAVPQAGPGEVRVKVMAAGVMPIDGKIRQGYAPPGGLGTFAVQLALAWGAGSVIGTASEHNHAYLQKLGAIPVAYGEGLEKRVRAAAPSGINAAFAAVDSEEALRVSAALVADKSRIRSMLPRPLIRELGIPPLEGVRSASRLSELVQLYEEGKVNVRIRRVYPLRDAELAHREIDGGHGSGKIVLRIGEA